jgi:UDPglucose 6-dehydrogenase
MRIVVVGAGYVGLVSGACLSEFGHIVTCVDNDPAKIRALQAGEIPIFEPGLEQVIEANVRAGRLEFSTNLSGPVKKAEVVFIAVGTPSRRGDGHADLTYVFEAANEIAQNIDGYTVIVNKSTVPVGTCSKVYKLIREQRPDADFDVASNPEFLREGSAITDFRHPDRVVVGCESDRAKDVMQEVYRPLFINETPMLFTNPESAELIKYASNAFLATKIAFINEMADLCEKVGADVKDVARGMGLDKRIGPKFLHAGPGYGGSCFPKDTLALLKTSQDEGATTRIIEAVVSVNDTRKVAMAERIAAAFGGDLRNKTIALLGLSFKPNTDDLREAPSLAIVPALKAMGARIRAYDPECMKQAREMLDIEPCADAYETMQGADGLVLLTEWNEFRALNLVKVKELLSTPLIVDLRNIYAPPQMASYGFTYISIGRKNVGAMPVDSRVLVS